MESGIILPTGGIVHESHRRGRWFVLHERQVLLLQRNHGAFLGKWTVQAGWWSSGRHRARPPSGELTESEEGRAEWVPVHCLHETGMIRHTTTGTPVSYELCHYTLDEVRTLKG